MIIFLLTLFLPLNAMAGLIDTNATTGTKALYTQLQNAQGNYIYFGQKRFMQQTSISANGTDPYLADSFRISGKFPYIHEERLYQEDGTLTNSTQTGFGKLHYRQGGIVAYSLSMWNVVTGGSTTDRTGDPVTNVLVGGTHRIEFLAKLDEVANYFLSMIDDNGNLIPVLFRPYHEMDGAWYWWGDIDGTTDDEFKQLWIDTVTYLRDTKGVHNLIYVFAPDGSQVKSFEDLYPGDDYVDIVGVDQYPDIDGETTDNGTADDAMPAYELCSDFATTHNKIFSITEGLRRLGLWEMADYWTNGLINPILNNTKAKKAAYILIWVSQSWGPKYGRSDAPSFLAMSQNPKVRMLEYKSGLKLRGISRSGVKIGA